MLRDDAPGFLNLEELQKANCHLLASLTYKRAVAKNGSDLQMTTGVLSLDRSTDNFSEQ